LPPTPLAPACIYFAGKVVKKRTSRTIDVADGPPCGGLLPLNGTVFLEDNGLNYDKGDRNYTCTGPVVNGCDHGCSHGATLHGAGAACRQEEVFSSRDAIQKQCMLQIDGSDAVVLALGKNDGPHISCFGSLVELGYAHAKKKFVVVTFDDMVTSDVRADLWFAASLALESLSRFKRVNGGWSLVASVFDALPELRALGVNDYERGLEELMSWEHARAPSAEPPDEEGA
jgi:hypothetical protein